MHATTNDQTFPASRGSFPGKKEPLLAGKTKLRLVRKCLLLKFFHWCTLFRVTFVFPLFLHTENVLDAKKIHWTLPGADTVHFDQNGKKEEITLCPSLEEFILL